MDWPRFASVAGVILMAASLVYVRIGMPREPRSAKAETSWSCPRARSRSLSRRGRQGGEVVPMGLSERFDLWVQSHPVVAVGFMTLCAIAVTTADGWFA